MFGAEAALEESSTLISFANNKKKRVPSAIDKGYSGSYRGLAHILQGEELGILDRDNFWGRIINEKTEKLLWTTVYNNSNGRGPLDSLSKACSQLRREIKAWAHTERMEFFNSQSFGVVHKYHTCFIFMFRRGESGSEFYLCKRPRNLAQVELFGLWKDVMRQLRSNDAEKIGERIRCRIRDHGWRERDLLRAVQKQVEKGAEVGMLANCEYMYSYYLWPKTYRTELDS
ncbi:hypothetical protein N431DRAFT_475306 [Stipitochalara longipes BDJ]|nr:hypothetical protein N431DRAFT_475306 [Stipitochalara longipes BDJ]